MNDITYAFAIGPGKLSQQGRWLLQSIKANTDATREDIISFLVSSERERISNETVEYFEQNSTLIEGEMPNPDYPLSAAHAALEQATQKSKYDYTILLDTDTVVLDGITVHQDNDSELFLVPSPISTLYWTNTEQSSDDWSDLYEKYDIEWPEKRVRSTVHDKEMLPYFDSGVIITKNETDFASRWKNVSKEIHGELPEMNYYTDNVSIGLLSNLYDLKVLPESYNYTQKAYICPAPTDTKIIHYNDTTSLYRSLNNPSIKRRLQSTEVADYFDGVPTASFNYLLLASYIKAFELSNPDSYVSKIISGIIEFQLKLRELHS